MNKKRELSIGEVSKQTGISVYTIRQWERRYGYPIALKLGSGHRRYSSDEVARLKLVFKAIEIGHRAGRVVPLDVLKLKELLNAHERSFEKYSFFEPWLDAVKNLDEYSLNTFFKNDWESQGPIGFLDQKLSPFLIKLGQEWEQRKITVFQEHFFSEIAESFLSKFWRDKNDENKNQKESLIICTLEGEDHSIGLHMLAVILTLLGKKVIFLGPSTPTEDIINSINRVPQSHLCLSFSTYYAEDEAIEKIEKIKKNADRKFNILLGGAGAPRELKDTIYFSTLSSLYNEFRYENN